ncbi:MAG: cellulose synthase catalytic subunit [Cyanobacteriota bacterium]|nr:cellulose synthase catalytic subunit [Cyanobacteriota bacterium]
MLWLPAALVLAWALLLRRRPGAIQPISRRRCAIVVLTLLSSHYLLWRSTATLNLSSPAALALSLLLLAAEATLLLHSLLQLGLAWFPTPPVEREAAAAAQQLAEQLQAEPAAAPAVEVLVPSCGEPLSVVERCLRACLDLDYPHFQVWLLDDAGRPQLEELCRQLGCRYLSRPDRRHAKAGNLNHALPLLEGELLVVFDADVVPQHPFLRRTVGLFADPSVALVQTPQSYMNADPVIRNLGLERWLMPDEEYFYRWIEPTRQAVNAVVCAGTSFLVRRSALVAVGGFETGTASEDLATGIRLSAAGHRVLYLNDKLSAGLAPPTLLAMAHQRSRWASGTLQTLRTGANPLRIAGLRPLQRLAFLEGILHWCNVLPQLVLLLMPLSFGLLGVPPLQLRDHGLITTALPLLLAQLLLVRWFSHNSRSALMPELYRWVFLGPLLVAVLSTVFGRPLAFRVTPKSASTATPNPALPLLLPLLVLLTLQLANLLLLLRGPNPALPLVWSALAILALLAGVRACWDRIQPAEDTPDGDDQPPWFAPLHLEGVLQQGDQRWCAKLRAISEQGVELEWSAPPSAPWPSQAPLTLQLDALGDGPLTLQPQQLRRQGHRVQLGGQWRCTSPLLRHLLQARLLQQPGCWPVRKAPPEPGALLALAANLLRPQQPQGWFHRSALPITLGGGWGSSRAAELHHPGSMGS